MPVGKRDEKLPCGWKSHGAADARYMCGSYGCKDLMVCDLEIGIRMSLICNG
jgi:hypothetical protein